jgi:hypothetical protein
MNQIAGVDGFNIMNNLRLVVIVAIFIILIIVLFYNRILGSRKRVKQKDMQAVNPSDASSREERHASDVVGDFFGKGESKEKEESKGGESTAESEVEIEGHPAVSYEKIEADLKAVRAEVAAKIETDLKAVEGEVTTKIEADLKAVGDEVTTKIEGLISKVEAVEKEVLNKIEDVIDAKIQEASNKINDGLSEAIRTQINSINPVSEERADSLHKEEVPADILSSEDMVAPEEIKEKEQTDKIAPSGEIEEKKKRDSEVPVEDSDIMEKFRLFVRYQLDAFDILPLDESKTVAEVKKDVKVDEKESIDAITSTGEVGKKISRGGAGESVDPVRLFFQKFLSVGIPSTEEPNASVEEKVEIEEKISEGDLEVPSEVKEDVKVDENEPIEAITSTGEIEEKISEGDAGELVDFDIEKFLEEEPVGLLSTEEPKESVEEKIELKEEIEIDLEVPSEVKEDVKVEEKEPIESIISTGEVEKKISEGDVGESDDFDIEKLLEEEPVGMSSTEESMEVEEKVEFKFKEEKEGDLDLPAEETVAHEGIDEKEIDTIAPGDIEEKALEVAKGEEAEEKKQSTGESSDFDIQEFLEELGTPPSEKDLESEKK